ncbi:unnamed protein product [Ilex paraguariensis]|uniref:Uncharacterized protein n=1 Tax=Ilex paraguariensis TaxID=185542 RepID=A0ABC8TIV7_9AQUA
MGTDMVLQLGLLIFSLGIFFALQNFSKQALTKLRTKNRSTAECHRHFVQAAQLLAKSRSSRNKTTSLNLAKSAVVEADKALSIEPKNPAAHILKALAQDLMGHKSSAIRSLDIALSPPALKSLPERERADALIKRAELQIAVNRKRRVDSAVADLVEAVRLYGDNTNRNSKAFCLLGQCYETKGLREEAKNAFAEALRIEPGSVVARDGLNRLGS